MQKCSKLSTKWKKKFNLGLCISSEPTNSAHCLGVKSIIPRESPPLMATALIHRQGRGMLCLLAWKGRAACLLWKQCQVSSPCSGGLPSGLGFSPLLVESISRARWVELSHTSRATPRPAPAPAPSHLSVLAFRDRGGQRRFIMDRFAILLVHYFSITFGNRKPYKVSV